MQGGDAERRAQAWARRQGEAGALLARSALGDRRAFEQLYALTRAHLYGVILRVQHDRGVAEELLQEVYVSVWRSAGSFDAAQAQPMTWLASIARHRAIDSLRRAQARPQAVSLTRDDDERGDGLDGEGDLKDEAPGPLELLAEASQARELSRCLEGLSAAQRQSVALAYFDGLSHAEVADHLRQPLGTVKSWVRRALQALRSCLDRAVGREHPASGMVGGR